MLAKGGPIEIVAGHFASPSRLVDHPSERLKNSWQESKVYFMSSHAVASTHHHFAGRDKWRTKGSEVSCTGHDDGFYNACVMVATKRLNYFETLL